jgi:xanthine dehydrogenase FAD-binding subunit
MFDIKSYTSVKGLEEALDCLKAQTEARVLAGGTDLLIRLREGQYPDADIVDITGLDELNHVYLDGKNDLHIGPLQSFRSLENNGLVKDLMSGLSAAASTVGGPQIRAVATVGGNLCNGVPSADSAPILFCCNALLVLSSPSGERKVEIADFYKGAGKVDIRQGEILSDIIIRREDYEGYKAHYMKFSQREAMDIATLGCALSVRHEDGILKDVRIAYGVAGPTPRRCPDAEEMMKGLNLDEKMEEKLDLFAELVKKELLTRDSWRGSKAFRDHLAGVLARRGLEKLTKGDCDHDHEN